MGQADTIPASWEVVLTAPAGDTVHPPSESIIEVVGRDSICMDVEVER